MPTPSEQVQTPKSEVQSPDSEWAARPDMSPCSVFGNYRPEPKVPPASSNSPNAASADFGLWPLASGLPLQAAIDTAMARSFLYRFLAHGYQDPTEEGWARLIETGHCQSFAAAVDTLETGPPRLAASAATLGRQLKPELFESFLSAYLAAFGHAARGSCPLNEIEYGDLKADPLFQPHRLADLAAFYRAFGLEVAEDADERHDHICLELEFLCVLTAKEGYALEHQLDSEELLVCRTAQRRFLREHLGRWTPAFARRLSRVALESPLRALADFTGDFIEAECARFGILPGSEDLLLRPVDAAAESLCQSCGPLAPSAPLVS